MAFFDKLSKTVTEASQKTIAKTKELADTSRLNSMISEQEKIINNQYIQIGKLYVSTHKDNFEDDFSGMITAIADAEAKIRDYKKQIQDIKGVQRCEKCGAEVQNGVAFCSACGNAMPKVEAFDTENYEKCTHCGAVIQKGMRFCTSCGTRMGTVVPVSNTQPELHANQTCIKCGAVIESGMKFCTVCGNKMDSSEPEANIQEEITKRFCTECGAELEMDVAFCTECGAKL